MGKLDSNLRIAAAAVVAILYFFDIISGTLAITLIAVAVIFVLTSFINFCPLYLPFGISTRQNKGENKK